MHVLPPIGVADQIFRYFESLEVSREWLPPRRRRLLSFSQYIVHEVYHVASGHSHAVAHEFASTVPFRLGVGFKSFHQLLGFLSQGFRNVVGDSGLYVIYSCRFRCFSRGTFLFASPCRAPQSFVSVVARLYRSCRRSDSRPDCSALPSPSLTNPFD